MTPTSAPDRPSRLDWIAAALVVISALAFALIRVQAINLPWHLATARLAHETGHWPAVNTFSYTFPDHPVYQQYPAFQATLYAALRAGGWGAVSLVSGLGWTLALLLFVRWGGPWRAGAILHVFWMVGLYALWRRMMVRPDLFSMLALGVELVALDAYARGRRWALALVPLAHLLWVNSHQLYPLSLVLQGAFAVHVLALRTRFFRRDEAPPPLVPVLLALAASIALTFATPLGFEILEGPARTAKSLALFRDNVAEFKRVWTMPLEFALTLLTGVPAAYGLARAWRRVDPFDVLVWLLSLALVVAAVRGLMFFGVVSIAVFQRSAARCRAAGVPFVPGLGPAATRALRHLGFAFTALLAANTIYHRWIHAPLTLRRHTAGLRPHDRWLGRGDDGLPARVTAARSHDERGPQRRRSRDPRRTGHPRLRRLAARIVPRRFPAQGPRRRPERRGPRCAASNSTALQVDHLAEHFRPQHPRARRAPPRRRLGARLRRQHDYIVLVPRHSRQRRLCGRAPRRPRARRAGGSRRGAARAARAQQRGLPARLT